MEKTAAPKKKMFDPTGSLNSEGLILWFDDFNEDDGFPPMNPNRFLSNFYVGEPIVMPGFPSVEFKTGEHAFAAFKAARDEEFQEIVDAKTPSEAKALGRMCKLRRDWEQIKYDVMAAVIRAKFQADRAEAELLLATGEVLLVEGTYWEDEAWGVNLTKDNRPGRNWLGTLLMARRAELKAEKAFGVRFETGYHNMEWVFDG